MFQHNSYRSLAGAEEGDTAIGEDARPGRDSFDAKPHGSHLRTVENTSGRRRDLLHLLLGSCLGMAVLLAIGAMSETFQLRECRKLPQSPAYDVIRWSASINRQQTHIGPHNIYSGAPKEESNIAWRKLLRGYNIRVPMRSIPKGQAPSIPLADDSGDMWMSLGVYHHLHCLDSLRHQLHGRDCDSQDNTFDDDGFALHFDHCIETIRQWLICQPDLLLRSIYWTPDGFSAAAANNSLTHQCLDWDAVEAWVDEHTMAGQDHVVRLPNGEWSDYIEPPPARCAVQVSESLEKTRAF